MCDGKADVSYSAGSVQVPSGVSSPPLSPSLPL